jgi:formamidopyrimidine-DNA glycosylase
MPELPEVQTTVNGINKYLKGLKIADVWTSYKSSHHAGKDNIKDPKFFAEFKKQIIGAKIIKASRRAKNILIELSNGNIILVHMKMTGHLMYGVYRFDSEDPKDPWKGVSPEALTDPFNRHIRFMLHFTNGKYLALSDMRRFAKVTYITKMDAEKTLHLKDLGPEPLEKKFDIKKLSERINKRPNGKIKQVLMDPKIVAGIGNIYSDEILWRTSIHPERKVKDITSSELE